MLRSFIYEINLFEIKSFIVWIPLFFNLLTICLYKDVIELNLLFSKFFMIIEESILKLFLQIFRTVSSIGYLIVSTFNPFPNESFVIFLSLKYCWLNKSLILNLLSSFFSKSPFIIFFIL